MNELHVWTAVPSEPAPVNLFKLYSVFQKSLFQTFWRSQQHEFYVYPSLPHQILQVAAVSELNEIENDNGSHDTEGEAYG